MHILSLEDDLDAIIEAMIALEQEVLALSRAIAEYNRVLLTPAKVQRMLKSMTRRLYSQRDVLKQQQQNQIISVEGELVREALSGRTERVSDIIQQLLKESKLSRTE